MGVCGGCVLMCMWWVCDGCGWMCVWWVCVCGGMGVVCGGGCVMGVV
jgi:hypothetical protein